MEFKKSKKNKNIIYGKINTELFKHVNWYLTVPLDSDEFHHQNLMLDVDEIVCIEEDLNCPYTFCLLFFLEDEEITPKIKLIFSTFGYLVTIKYILQKVYDFYFEIIQKEEYSLLIDHFRHTDKYQNIYQREISSCKAVNRIKFFSSDINNIKFTDLQLENKMYNTYCVKISVKK